MTIVAVTGRVLRGLLCLLPVFWLTGVLAQEAGEEKAGEENEPDQNARAETRDGPRLILAADRMDQALQARYPDQAVMLDNGEGTFAALELRETVARRQGAALIVTDAGQSPDSPLAHALRHHLPPGGWRTLSLTLPETGIKAMPERIFSPGGLGDGSEGEEETEAEEDQTEPRGLTLEVMSGEKPNGEAQEVFQAQALARVAAGVLHLRQAGYNNLVLIGIGAGADTVARFVQQNPQQLPAGELGMVWLAPRFKAPLDQDLEALFGAGWEVPVLDLVDSRTAQKKAAAGRRADADRGNFANYRQQTVPLTGVESAGSHKRIAYRVRGWLKMHMAGMEEP